MEPLLKQIDRNKTIKAVEEHMESFIKIRHYYSVIDAEEGNILPETQKNEGTSSPSKDKLLKQVNRTDYINHITQEYLDNLLKAINHLDPYYRKLILMKYFYDMECDEMGDYIGFSERKVSNDLRDAKVDLSFLLRCEKYKK